MGQNSTGQWPAERRTLIKLAIGFGVAAVLVYLLGAIVGWGETIEHLRAASLGWVAIASLSTLLCLVAWAKTWQVVLATMDISIPHRKLIVTFTAGQFVNYVTPMGQVGGEPFIAYILLHDTDATYEQSLASVVTADLLRLLPFFNVGLIGLGYLLLDAGLPGSVEQFAVVLTGLAVAVPVGAALTWRCRYPVKRATIRILTPLLRGTNRFSIENIQDRIDEFYESLELIAGSRRALTIALSFSYLGWILFALPLYFSAIALGLPVSILLMCFLVPVTVIAGSTPLPGGLAAIEGTLVVLLAALTAMSASEALAITTIYRLTSYWIVVFVGGVAALWVLARA